MNGSPSPSSIISDHQDRFLTDLEQHLVTTLCLLDDIQRECIRVGDHAGASFIAGISEAVIVFGNMYCRKL